MYQRVYFVVGITTLILMGAAVVAMWRRRDIMRRMQIGYVNYLYIVGFIFIATVISLAISALFTQNWLVFAASNLLLCFFSGFAVFGGTYLSTDAMARLLTQLHKRRNAERDLQRHQEHLQQLIHQRTEALREEIANRSELQLSLADHVRQMEKDLAFAARAQAAMRAKVPEARHARVFAQSFSRDEVNGDMYHAKMAQDGSLLLFVGDAMGHGAAAGFMTVMVGTALNNLNSELPPFIMLEELNRTLSGHDTGIFVTGVMTKIYPDGLCLISHAGHPATHVIRKNGDIESDDTGGFALGMFAPEGVHYDQAEIRLEAGDRLVLYTDGITEAANPAGEDFGVERMLNAFKSKQDKGLDEAVLCTLDVMYDFCEHTAIDDDITLLGAEFTA